MKKKLADEIGNAYIRLHCTQKPGKLEKWVKINDYLQPFREGRRPRMTPEEIYQELSGLTVMEICEELSSALDILNSIAEIEIRAII